MSIAAGGDGDRAAAKGKRDSGPRIGVGVDAAWRSPKQQRDSLWRAAEKNVADFPNSMFVSLRRSLKDVCSFDDLKQRMQVYLSLGSCKEIFEVMSQVAKVCCCFAWLLRKLREEKENEICQLKENSCM